MGGAQQEVTLPENPKGAFLPSAVNGVKSQALLDTGAGATIISEGQGGETAAHAPGNTRPLEFKMADENFNFAMQ